MDEKQIGFELSEEDKKTLELLQKAEKEEKERLAKAIVATKEKIIEDFQSYGLKIEIETAPNTKRVILARPLTQKEMKLLADIFVRYSKIGSALSATEAEKQELQEVMDSLAKLAASLSIDKSLDFNFWSEIAPFTVLMQFINGVAVKSQSLSLTQEEIESFRKD